MWDHIINIHQSELLRTKTKEFRINKHKFFFKKWTIYIFYLLLFKELKKYIRMTINNI